MSGRVNQQFGQYRLLRLLGQGGFAEVYLGEHVYLGTLAAIKVLHALVDEVDVGEFQREARMLASLKHPHIVRVLEFGVDGRTPYLVMDYAPGGTLRGRHPKGARVPVSTVVDYVKQVAQALQYAHDHKVVHRDIKPENILIGENGELLLSDFGIALIARTTRSQSAADMAGTIAYMAPEQINAHPGPASDQYSLAIVVYEWLSGDRPFDGSFMEIAIQHNIAPPPPVRGILPTLGPAVEQVILTALAKTPEERFATVHAFALALAEASVEHPTERSRPLDSVAPPDSPQPTTAVPSAPLAHMTNDTKSSTTPSVQPVQPTKTLVPLPDQTRLAPDVPAVETKTAQPVKNVSRRTVIIGAGVVATAAVTGGIFAIVHSPTSPRAASSGTLTVVTDQAANETSVLEDIAQKFMHENSNVRVDFSAEGSEYDNKMKLKIAAHVLPDVFATHGLAKVRYGSLLADLRDQSWVSSLSPTAKDIVTDQNGKVYVLPVDQDKSGLVYNVDILSHYGVAVPTTYDELLAACRAIKERSQGQVIPIHMGGADAWPIGQFFDIFSTPQLISPQYNYRNALLNGTFDWIKYTPLPQKLLDLLQAGYLNQDVLTATYADSTQAFAQGMVAFGIYGPYFVGDLKKINANVHAGLMPIPSIVPGDVPTFAGGEGVTWGVWKSSLNSDAAKQFVAFYARPENVARVAQADNLPPGLNTVNVDLGDLGGYYQKYSATPVFPYFNRAYLPDGMWNILCKNGQDLLAGAITPGQYSDNVGKEFYRLRASKLG